MRTILISNLEDNELKEVELFNGACPNEYALVDYYTGRVDTTCFAESIYDAAEHFCEAYGMEIVSE